MISLTDFIVVIPVYNEASRIRDTVYRLTQILDSHTIDYLLILAVDPSEDSSELVCDSLIADFPKIRVLRGSERSGRGLAVRRAWTEYDANLYSFIDADMSADEFSLYRAYEVMRNGKFDVLIGSRYTNGSRTTRPPLRRVISFSYNILLNIIFRDGISDHQCGLKIISDNVKTQMLSSTKVNSWFWDTELVVLAASRGYKICEMPLHWNESKYKRTPILRLVKDVIIHGWGMVLLYKRLKYWSAPLLHWAKLANKEEGKILKERSQIEGGPEGKQ